MGTYVNKVDGARKPSILASEVGLITKTRLIPATLGTADGNRKVVKQGTIFPLNDNTAEGIVFVGCGCNQRRPCSCCYCCWPCICKPPARTAERGR